MPQRALDSVPPCSRDFPNEEGTESEGRSGRTKAAIGSRDFPNEEGTESTSSAPRALFTRSSRDFPNEEGTESQSITISGTGGLTVPETSPMKRGLKASR